MAGIYGLFTNENFTKPQLFTYFYNYGFPNTIQEEIHYKATVVGRSVLNKFNKDRYLYEDDSFIICFEGINYSTLMTPEDVIKSYKATGHKFVNDFKGVFSGFLFSKKEDLFYVFNDPLGTKRIYYYFNPEVGFAFSSEMHTLSKYLRENNVGLSYDYDGIYSLALYGQMLNDFTVVKEIKRLGYASVLIYDLKAKELKQEKYYTFEKRVTPQKLPDIIDSVNTLMENAVKMEWEKDISNNYSNHLTLISGGMDSRINALIAKKLGFENIHGYTYGDPNSSDVKIAQTIAKDNFYSHSQFNLNNGDFFTKEILENYVKPTDGLTLFTANAIIYNALINLNTNHYGATHSGQLGDTVSGSFLKPNYDFIGNADKIGLTGFVRNKKLLNKISSLDELLRKYQNTDYEIYTYEQRQVNGTLAGDSTFSNFVDQVSPFYDLDLINYILTIPNKYKLNQQIYFSWLKEKHPNILDYKWEKLGMKPNSSFNLNYGRLIKKYVNGGKKYFNLRYDSMNPIGTWFAENPNHLLEFDKIYNSLIYDLGDAELQRDLEEIYKDNIFAYRNKFTVITVLLSLKLHFG